MPTTGECARCGHRLWIHSPPSLLTSHLAERCRQVDCDCPAFMTGGSLLPSASDTADTP